MDWDWYPVVMFLKELRLIFPYMAWTVATVLLMLGAAAVARRRVHKVYRDIPAALDELTAERMREKNTKIASLQRRNAYLEKKYERLVGQVQAARIMNRKTEELLGGYGHDHS